MQGAHIQSLIKKLRSHMLQSTAKRKVRRDMLQGKKVDTHGSSGPAGDE